LESLVRLLGHALRHNPEAHFLSVDSDGWADLSEVLLAARCQRKEFRRLKRDELQGIVDHMVPRRFEIQSARIRALYGHSLPHVETGVEQVPPTMLFHGTTVEAWERIAQSSLLPMNRRFAHLTTDWAYADQVAKAKLPGNPVVLAVAAQDAYKAGHRFLRANNHVWLSGPLAAPFLSRYAGRYAVSTAPAQHPEEPRQ
jgi:putative RNA 2'-phosphotransferase